MTKHFELALLNGLYRFSLQSSQMLSEWDQYQISSSVWFKTEISSDWQCDTESWWHKNYYKSAVAPHLRDSSDVLSCYRLDGLLGMHIINIYSLLNISETYCTVLRHWRLLNW